MRLKILWDTWLGRTILPMRVGKESGDVQNDVIWCRISDHTNASSRYHDTAMKWKKRQINLPVVRWYAVPCVNAKACALLEEFFK